MPEIPPSEKTEEKQVRSNFKCKICDAVYDNKKEMFDCKKSHSQTVADDEEDEKTEEKKDEKKDEKKKSSSVVKEDSESIALQIVFLIAGIILALIIAVILNYDPHTKKAEEKKVENANQQGKTAFDFLWRK